VLLPLPLQVLLHQIQRLAMSSTEHVLLLLLLLYLLLLLR
jgi:hypothetical protein